MIRTLEIDLEGEILPIGLLKCKYALEKMAPLDELCIRTDDPGLVENVAKFLRAGEHQVMRRCHEGRCYLIRILKH